MLARAALVGARQGSPGIVTDGTRRHQQDPLLGSSVAESYSPPANQKGWKPGLLSQGHAPAVVVDALRDGARQCVHQEAHAAQVVGDDAVGHAGFHQVVRRASSLSASSRATYPRGDPREASHEEQDIGCNQQPPGQPNARRVYEQSVRRHHGFASEEACPTWHSDGSLPSWVS